MAPLDATTPSNYSNTANYHIEVRNDADTTSTTTLSDSSMRAQRRVRNRVVFGLIHVVATGDVSGRDLRARAKRLARDAILAKRSVWADESLRNASELRPAIPAGASRRAPMSPRLLRRAVPPARFSTYQGEFA